MFTKCDLLTMPALVQKEAEAICGTMTQLSHSASPGFMLGSSSNTSSPTLHTCVHQVSHKKTNIPASRQSWQMLLAVGKAFSCIGIEGMHDKPRVCRKLSYHKGPLQHSEQASNNNQMSASRSLDAPRFKPSGRDITVKINKMYRTQGCLTACSLHTALGQPFVPCMHILTRALQWGHDRSAMMHAGPEVRAFLQVLHQCCLVYDRST